MNPNLPDNSSVVSDQAIWFLDHEEVTGRGAAAQAQRVIGWIENDAHRDQRLTERTLFVAMHTCTFQAQRVKGRTRRTAALRGAWLDRRMAIRDYIVESNFGLTYSMIGQYGPGEVSDDLFSDAQLALINAVDKFNPFRGYRFSTYACSAIHNALMYRRKKAADYHRRFIVHHDTTVDRAEPESDTSLDLYVERLRRALDRNLGGLTPVESEVLDYRFPLEEERRRLTLRQLGNIMGVSKERVRQIQNAALLKIREVLDEDAALT